MLIAAIWAPAAAAQDASIRQHVQSAEQLVRALDLAHTNYEHGAGNIVWSGIVESHTDCSGFIDLLLAHDDGYTPDDFKRWFGSRRPTASRYHDAIVEGRGFIALATIAELRAGDVIAIKYFTRKDNTGHIMLVDGTPRRIRATPPLIDGTTQWEIDVIDSSESGHGVSDSRHKRGDDGRDHDGLGKGVFRLYSDAQGAVAGFSWSTLKASKFVAPADEHAVLGRFIAGFKP
jgi:hypothetical protein